MIAYMMVTSAESESGSDGQCRAQVRVEKEKEKGKGRREDGCERKEESSGLLVSWTGYVEGV